MTQQNAPKCPRCGSRERDVHKALAHDSPSLHLCLDDWHREPAAPRDCDLRNGDVQCPARLAMGGGDFLFCRYVVGHSGKHRTNYEPGTEWATSAAPPEGETDGTGIDVQNNNGSTLPSVGSPSSDPQRGVVASPGMSARDCAEHIIATYDLVDPGRRSRDYTQIVDAATKRIEDYAAEHIERFDAILRRHEDFFDWLKTNHPEVFVEQKHCEEGSSERAYWHHGYMMAIRDVMRALGVMPSELSRFNDQGGREKWTT